MAVLAAAIAMGSLASVAEEEVLFWMVNEQAMAYDNTGTGSSLANLFRDYGMNYDGASARIRVTGGGISGDRYLGIYFADPNTSVVTVESGEFGVAFDDGTGSGYWGAGVPTGNQSPIGQYAAGSPEYSFTVEIGNYEWDDSTQSGSWTTVAVSDAVPYSYLGNYIHTTFDLNAPSTLAWTPTVFHVVPEPSALLLLIGGGVITLKRRHIP